MLKFTKGDAVKFVDPQSTLIPILKADKWAVEGEEAEEVSERDLLKAEADKLGIKYAKNISAEKLALLIADKKAE